MNMNSMLRIYRELHTKGLLREGSSDHRLNRRKTGLRLCYSPLQNPNHNRGTTLSLLWKLIQGSTRVSMQMAPKLRTRGAPVREILPPHSKNAKKEGERKASACLTSAKTNRKEVGAGGRLRVVNLQSNEWAPPKICHPLALHVVNIQLEPDRRPLFALFSPTETDKNSLLAAVLPLLSC